MAVLDRDRPVDGEPLCPVHVEHLGDDEIEAKQVPDELRLTRVSTNIMADAVKYAPPCSRINVELFTDDDCAVARAIVEGDGFVPEDENSLFMPFGRAGADKLVGHSGSGIWLTLAAGIFEAHGGHIVTNSRDRSGACFAIRIALGD